MFFLNGFWKSRGSRVIVELVEAEVLRRVCRYVRLDYVSEMDSGGGSATRLVSALGGGDGGRRKGEKKKNPPMVFFLFFNLAIS